MSFLRPADIIALVVIVGCFVLIGFGKGDPMMFSTLATVCGFYFGRQSKASELPRENGK